VSGTVKMLVGKPTGRYRQGTIVLVSRKPRSKWWKVVCFGQKGHYREDGSCAHTDEVLASLNPDIAPAERVRVTGWGNRDEAIA
jgi:hypothetical protein